MYTTKILKEGIEFLGITDHDVIRSIINNNYENRFFLLEQEIIKNEKEDWENRFKVPDDLNKKQLLALQKDTQVKIDYEKERWRKAKDEYTRMSSDMEKEKWVMKKVKIINVLKFNETFIKNNTFSIEKAKQYPIEQLMDFKGGFTKCIFHDEKTGSMKLYKDKNRVHCFSCNQGWDAIDIYQRLNNVDFNTAVKKLS